MTIDDIIKKLSFEMVVVSGHPEDIAIYQQYIQMAIAITLEHLTPRMEEVMAYDLIGNEAGKFKSIDEASVKLHVDKRNIHHVLKGERHSAGGYVFIRSKDKVINT